MRNLQEMNADELRKYYREHGDTIPQTWNTPEFDVKMKERGIIYNALRTKYETEQILKQSKN